jgi:hypothetical protein
MSAVIILLLCRFLLVLAGPHPRACTRVPGPDGQRRCDLLFLWPQAHVQQRAGDAGGAQWHVLHVLHVLYCMLLLLHCRSHANFYCCGLKRMYSSVLEMLEVRSSMSYTCYMCYIACYFFCIAGHMQISTAVASGACTVACEPVLEGAYKSHALHCGIALCQCGVVSLLSDFTLPCTL